MLFKRTLSLIFLVLSLNVIAFENEIKVGSNFVVSSLGDYPTEGAPIGWFGLNGKKPVLPIIGRLHQNRSNIIHQLKHIKKSGQEVISLVIWYANLSQGQEPDGINDGVYGHVIDSSQYQLNPQHQKNLKELLIFLNKLDFKELNLRFAAQGMNDPSWWESSDWSQVNGNTGMTYEGIFQQNWNFIANTKNLIDENKRSLKVTYDLGVELGGVTRKQVPNYVKRLMGNWCYVFTCADTYGFSIAWDINALFDSPEGRVRKYIDTLKSLNITPTQIAIDFYGQDDHLLQVLKQHLNEKNLSDIEVIIQETYANDRPMMNNIFKSLFQKDLNITHLFQWPVERESSLAHFSTIHYERIYNYLGSSYVGHMGLGCEDMRCLWILGVQFPEQLEVRLYAGDWRHGNKPLTILKNVNRINSGHITLRIPDAVYEQYDSLNIVITNSASHIAFGAGWSDPRHILIK